MASNSLDECEESQLEEIQNEFGEENEHLEENVFASNKRTGDSRNKSKQAKKWTTHDVSRLTDNSLIILVKYPRSSLLRIHCRVFPLFGRSSSCKTSYAIKIANAARTVL